MKYFANVDEDTREPVVEVVLPPNGTMLFLTPASAREMAKALIETATHAEFMATYAKWRHDTNGVSHTARSLDMAIQGEMHQLATRLGW